MNGRFCAEVLPDQVITVEDGSKRKVYWKCPICDKV